MPGPMVTNAKGGQSAHNLGLAIDFVRDLDRSKQGSSRGGSREDFAILIEEAKKRGLHSGQGYKDLPHISWPGYVTATDMLPLDMYLADDRPHAATPTGSRRCGKLCATRLRTRRPTWEK